MSNQLFIQIIILCSFFTFCITCVIFSVVYALGKYTDFGNVKRQQNNKKKKIQNPQDDLPISELPFSTPTIETSFGDERIGTVYKHEHNP
jgi:hypothetical protein|tara:strand:+ start:154 stop:423 length:270 start_codon:yes stop_codon:yes gene_type:complete